MLLSKIDNVSPSLSKIDRLALRKEISKELDEIELKIRTIHLDVYREASRNPLQSPF